MYLGSLNDTVKAVKIDGAEATVENIKSGTYKIARPFNIATKGEVSEAAQDFINYIMSGDGQKVISDNGYIGDDSAAAFESNGAEGKVRSRRFLFRISGNGETDRGLQGSQCKRGDRASDK